MRYMLLIYNAEDATPQLPPEAASAEVGKWVSYTMALQAAGVFIAGDPLQGVDTATTVRVRSDKVMMTDGPFAETKEHLLGYYLIDCENLDAALDWATKVPSVGYGSVEVRPLLDFPMPN
jgi:hypothetical protein